LGLGGLGGGTPTGGKLLPGGGEGAFGGFGAATFLEPRRRTLGFVDGDPTPLEATNASDAEDG